MIALNKFTCSTAEGRAPSLSSPEQTYRINPDPKHFTDLGKALLSAKFDG